MGSVINEMSVSEKEAFTLGTRKRKLSPSIASPGSNNKENKNLAQRRHVPPSDNKENSVKNYLNEDDEERGSKLIVR